MNNDLIISVSEFIALFNQTMEFAYPDIVIVGELANLRISKNKWVYFDLKDEHCSLKFFGSVYKLPGPLEDGMILKVRGQPRLHNLYGFSVNVVSIQPAGEGSIRKAADLLKQKLESEGLFDNLRKRTLPYPPSHIGLITSDQSAAYADFIKIINARWRGVSIDLINVLVQGEAAPSQITLALEHLNSQAQPPEAIIVIRGGGSPEDLAAFSSEQVTRAVATSRIPTLVAIGHEVDISLAELAADKRASTPSNAAELLVPDFKSVIGELSSMHRNINQIIKNKLELSRLHLNNERTEVGQIITSLVRQSKEYIKVQLNLIEAFNPQAVLRRGYSISRNDAGSVITKASDVEIGDNIKLQLYEGGLTANIKLKQAKG
jgi:exodeoxyribonuclease VII large subunit